MGKSVERDQSHAIMAILSTNVDWDGLDGDLLQERVIRNPKEAGRHFSLFLKNGARMPVVGDFKVATAPFDLSFVGKGWKTISEEEDERSAKLTEVDFAKVKFVSCLQGENSIKGEEKLRRLKEAGDIRLGATVFMALWQDYQSKKENSVLERLYQAGTIKGYLDFFGTILLSLGGRRRVLYLCRGGDGEWCWRVYWLEYGWYVKHLSAVLP
jgi:hypothetical protein